MYVGLTTNLQLMIDHICNRIHHCLGVYESIRKLISLFCLNQYFFMNIAQLGGRATQQHRGLPVTCWPNTVLRWFSVQADQPQHTVQCQPDLAGVDASRHCSICYLSSNQTKPRHQCVNGLNSHIYFINLTIIIL